MTTVELAEPGHKAPVRSFRDRAQGTKESGDRCKGEDGSGERTPRGRLRRLRGKEEGRKRREGGRT